MSFQDLGDSGQSLSHRVMAARLANLEGYERSHPVAERCRVDMGEAFTMLRKHARNNNLRLADVAKGVVAGTIELNPVPANQRR